MEQRTQNYFKGESVVLSQPIAADLHLEPEAVAAYKDEAGVIQPATLRLKVQLFKICNIFHHFCFIVHLIWLNW